MLYVFGPNGQCLAKCGTIVLKTGLPPSDKVFIDKYGPDIIIKNYAVDPLPGVAAEDITATIFGGEVVGDPQGPPAPPTLWVHVTLTGGSTSPAGTLYIKNDGVDSLGVSAHLRDGPELATSSAVTQIDEQDITGQWALELENVDTGALADTPLVQMAQGAISVTYTTAIAPCEVRLSEGRFEMVGPPGNLHQLKLAQEVGFKVVRALA